MARNPKQDANLKPIQKGDLSKEELKKRQSNGGKKSGEVRRAKRDAKSAIRYLLDLPPTVSVKANLKEMGFPVNEQTNMAALQARLFTMAMGGNIEAYNTLMKMAGYEPEENRKERESIASDIRREKELEAKVNALGGDMDGAKLAVNLQDEDENNDVVIYMPQTASEESCTVKEDEPESEDTEQPADTE
nr:MAG TPA: hypothetical protein [Caudoviricetes sp.]